MTLTINIPDAVAAQLVQGICDGTNYDAASGKTKAEWAKDQVVRSMKAMAANGAMRAAMTTTRATLDSAGIS